MGGAVGKLLNHMNAKKKKRERSSGCGLFFPSIVQDYYVQFSLETNKHFQESAHGK